MNQIFENANKWLNDLVVYIPGKPIEDVARELGLEASQIVKPASRIHQAKTLEIVRSGRDFLQAEFGKRKLEYVPSVANFVLVKVGNGKEVFQKFLRRGMIVRAMDEYKLPDWIRVSVGTPEQNQRFLANLDQVLEERGGGEEGRSGE